MENTPRPSKIAGIFLNRCPVCDRAGVFRGPYLMNAACPHCGVVYQREDGYFMGALVLAYFSTGAVIAPVFLWLLFFLQWELGASLLVISLLVFATNPIFFYLSRMMWIHMDREVGRRAWDQDKRGG